ncbi:MAG: tRNA nucleotidyltransferase [Bordetella sp.]|nr:MAG: tRNA nucleotidyltransferase [Bordetella sp.]
MEDEIIQGLEIYLVGGTIRDNLIGLPSSGDFDWVVIGSDSKEMINRGFVSVGNHFPVFLHPISKEEYALARTEKKIGKGYRGFTFYTGADVTLTDDLFRRDLTINAIAKSSTGQLIDPFNGIQDIKRKRLNHVSSAFKEDPVRILRLARFCAKFSDFFVSEETLDLCKMMVKTGEVNNLISERVWKEISRGLLSETPSKMFDFLEYTGALINIIPELKISDLVKRRLDNLPNDVNLSMRYAILCFDSKLKEMIHKRFRAPKNCIENANLFPIISQELKKPFLDAKDQLFLLEKTDALRKPDRFIEFLRIFSFVEGKNIDRSIWKNRINKLRTINISSLSEFSKKENIHIKYEIRKARLKILDT